MPHEIVITKDGSHTLYLAELSEHYHSIHGAYTESMHVFIHAGLHAKLNKQTSISVLEVGLGTGLNALLTIRESMGANSSINYTAIEPFPLQMRLVNQLNYLDLPDYNFSKEWVLKIHDSKFNSLITIEEKFVFQKMNDTLENIHFTDHYDLVYFDAFGPRVQPDIWHKNNFLKLYNAMSSAGVLVTYCSKGDVRRSLQEVGFMVEKIPGPPGKREMLRAIKQ